MKEKFGFRALVKPKLTQSLGPWTLDIPSQKRSSALGRQNDLYLRLIDSLPQHQLLWQNFAPEVTNWLPFYWKSFSQTTRYSCTLDLSIGEAALFSGLTKSRRQDVRRAQKNLHVDRTGDIGELMNLVRLTFARQNLDTPYSQGYLERIDEAVVKNAHRSILLARDEASGEVHAATYTISDGHRTYLLVSGQNPELRDSGAGSLLTWTAVRDAISSSDIFDFEGSMIEPIERFYRSFGSRQTPYFHIERAGRGGVAATSAWTLANGLRTAAKGWVTSATRN